MANDPETAQELAEQVETLLGEEYDIRAFLGRRGYELREGRLVKDVQRIIWGLEQRIEQLQESALPYRRREQALLPSDARPVYTGPDFEEELDEEDQPYDPPRLLAGWDLAWGARLTFHGAGEEIDLTLSISDAVQRNGICTRTATREQLGQFAANLLRIVNGDAPSHHRRWQQMLEEHGIGAVLDAPVQFWYCKDHDKGTVEWHGNVARCMEPGCTNSNEKSKEDSQNMGKGDLPKKGPLTAGEKVAKNQRVADIKKATDNATGKGPKPHFGTKEWAKERGVFKEGDQ